MSYSYRSKNPLIASIENVNKLNGVSEGSTVVEVFDEAGTYRGKIPVSVTANSSSVEPTGISLDKSFVKLYNTGGDTAAWLTATVTPANATNKTVVWESSDPSLVQVSNSGKVVVVKGTKSGTVTITASTYNGSAYDTCSVIVKAQGTVINGINPSEKSGIPAGGSASSRTFSVDLDYEVLNNYDSGFTDTGDYNYYSIARPADGGTKSPLSVTVKENFGNAREFQIILSGNFTGDSGKVLTVKQLGSTVIKGFKYFTSGYCYANGTFYHNSQSTFSGALHYICAAGNARNILNGVTSSDWIHVNTNKWGIESSGKYTSAQLEEYDRTGKIGGKNPGFNGVTVVAWVNITVDANKGASRTGTITFPGNKVFTIYQDAAQ